MPKANKKCYCCGREYYYCPSCSGERKDPRIYTMWDSETCRDIFNTLVNESTKKITTLECKKKLIELGVNKDTVLKDSVRKHVDRVMSCKDDVIKKVKKDIVEESSVVSEENKTEEKVENIITNSETVKDIVKSEFNIENIKKTKRAKKSSLKNEENSEVD